MADYCVGQRFTRPDGAALLISIVSDGEIYFVSWLKDQEWGTPLRMPYDDFTKGLELAGMEYLDETS